MNNSHNYSGRPRGSFMYTHQLPYGVRQHICNLIDADQSWRLLGGEFMHLDATQLRLVGQALLRNDSPTGELLNKLDSANMRISELFNYLNHMGHCRATEILKPYVIEEQHAQPEPMDQNGGSLDTPTPSFSSIQPMAVMSSAEFNTIAPADYLNQNPDEWNFVEGNPNKAAEIEPPNRCHNGGSQAVAIAIAPAPAPTPAVASKQPVLIDLDELALEARRRASKDLGPQDPGDEIVRMACANNRKRTSISDQEVVNQLRLIMQINYSELKQASNDFADTNILGNGGFASVYRGYWKGTDVAIKRLRCNLMDQALNELTILNSYRIDNILPIYGISIDGPEACLVYQFMANGSLEDRLSCKGATPALSWQQRAMIAEGVAKGLYYLHTLRDKPLVHGDAKSANVLLDAQFVPKLGDFGLARQVFKGKNPQTEHCTHCTVSSIHGTSVYLPPEYLRHKILSPAVDVYSYGIVLLEMVTGKRAYDGKRLLIDFVEDELKSGQQQRRRPHLISSNLKDPRLVDSSQGEQRICSELLLRLGINCAHRIKKKRPDMGQVLNHFAQFRLSASTQNGAQISNQVDIFNPISGATTPASNATTRTLTPDLVVLNCETNGTTTPAPFKLAKPQGVANGFAQRDSSHLMSVEQEYDLLQQEQATNVARMGDQERHLDGGNQIDLESNQIEAMIPLLTELGFSPQLEEHDGGEQIK